MVNLLKDVYFKVPSCDKKTVLYCYYDWPYKIWSVSESSTRTGWSDQCPTNAVKRGWSGSYHSGNAGMNFRMIARQPFAVTYIGWPNLPACMSKFNIACVLSLFLNSPHCSLDFPLTWPRICCPSTDERKNKNNWYL